MKKIIFALCGSLFFTSLAFGGDTYNGPETEGVSIPVLSDTTEITMDHLKSVYYTCSLNLLNEIIPQMPDSEYLVDPKCKVDIPDGHLVSDCIAGRSFRPGLGMLLEPEKRSPEPTRMLADLQISSRPSEGDKFVLLTKFPLLQYTETEVSDGYDDYGNPINPRFVAVDTKINVPNNFGEAVPLINSHTNQETKVKVNTVAFKDCLSTLLQN